MYSTIPPPKHRGVPWLLAAGLLLGSACTDAKLYSDTGPLAQADRIALTGRVCTRDPLTAELPLRIAIVADVAAGPLYASFDPGSQRVQILRAFVQSTLNSLDTELAVVSFAGRSRKLAPIEGNFTRNPGELLAAINQLAVAEPCLGADQCRDYLEGMRTARALIEGDLAESPAGLRVLTQYVILLVLAGPHQPMAENIDCCALDDAACLSQPPAPDQACQAQLEQEELASTIAAIEAAGALGLKLHVIHLAADPDPAVNDQIQNQMENLVFTGSGSYQRFATADSLSPSALDVIEARTALRVKTLFVANTNAKPTPTGPVVDSDGDGLSDAEEDLDPRVSATDPDTDDDGLGDLVETLVDFDPSTPDMPTACAQVDPMKDTDLEGLSDCDEALLGTELSLVDTDGDAMPDSLELISNTDYLHRDAETDSDGDGASNGDEVLQRTDPRSIDTQSHLSYAYRYDMDDEGVVSELYALPMLQLTGVEVVSTSAGTTPGVGLLRYDAAAVTLEWQDALDTTLGPAVDVSDGGEFDLPSSSWAPEQGDEGRLIRVRVTLADLPPDSVAESLRFILREHQCLDYTVRNIQLMDTRALDDGTEAGMNRIVLFFGETPEGRIGSPGPYRLAVIPVLFVPPATRFPDAPVLEVLDEEFVSPR